MTLKDGEATWADYMRQEEPADSKAADRIGGPNDPIPGLDPTKPEDPFKAPARAQARKPRTVAAQPVAAPAVTATPQQRLADLVTTAGFTFDDFRKWGDQSGNVDNADSLASFDDVPNGVAERLLRAPDGLKTQLAAVKGGIA